MTMNTLALADSVRSLLIPFYGHTFLLPSAIIAEVKPYQKPELLKAAPHWLHGILDWREQRVPLLAVDKLMNLEADKTHIEQLHTIVLYGIEAPANLPFYAFIATDIPRTHPLQSSVFKGHTEIETHGLLFKTSLDIENTQLEALVPDLAYLESLLRKSASVLNLSEH